MSEPSMWAEVVADEETCKLFWRCQEADGRGEISSHQIVELAADTFPIGTRMTIVEPEQRTCPTCQGNGEIITADALSSLVRERDEALKVLRDHHKWHAESGILGIPDGDGGWIEMDNGAEYGDSRLYERTVEALRDMPPEFVVPPRGGWAMGSNHWENWQLAYRQKRAAEARATAAEADLEQTRAMYENLEASEVLAGYKNRLAAAEADAARMREALAPFAAIPPHGTFGGPLVGLLPRYEDGSNGDMLGHEPVRRARAALSNTSEGGKDE